MRPFGHNITKQSEPKHQGSRYLLTDKFQFKEKPSSSLDKSHGPQPFPFVQGGNEPTSYRNEEPISQHTQVILDAVAEVKQQITELQAMPAEVQEIKQILQKQEGRWASLIRSLKQFINLTN